MYIYVATRFWFDIWLLDKFTYDKVLMLLLMLEFTTVDLTVTVVVVVVKDWAPPTTIAKAQSQMTTDEGR